MADAPLSKVVDDLLARMREPLGLDRWTIKVEFGPGENTAACSAMPEYETALISVDPDRLQTGDELDEILAHELAHAPIWHIAAVADAFAIALAKAMPDYLREPMAECLKEVARDAEETTATLVGKTYIRLLRRLWRAEADLVAARQEIRALKKQLPAG